MSRGNSNQFYRDSSNLSILEDDNEMEGEGEGSFYMEIQKVSTPSGSGRTRTVVKDKRMEESNAESERMLLNSRIVVPPWLNQEKQSSIKRERTLSPPPPWLANHLYKSQEPAQITISEPLNQPTNLESFYYNLDRSNQYSTNVSDLNSSSSPPIQVPPPFSTSGRPFSRSSNRYQEPPRPFYKAQLSNANVRGTTSPSLIHSQMGLNFDDAQSTSFENTRDLYRQISSPSSPTIHPPRLSFSPQSSQYQASLSSFGYPSHLIDKSNFELFRKPQYFSSDAEINPTTWNNAINDTQRVERESSASFWKDSPNIGISIHESNLPTNHRDQFRTRLLREAYPYSQALDQTHFDPAFPFAPIPHLTDIVNEHLPLELTQITPLVSLSSQQSNRRTPPLRYSQLPQQEAENLAVLNRPHSNQNSITPIPTSTLEDLHTLINTTKPTQNQVEVENEDEELWKAVDGIIDDSLLLVDAAGDLQDLVQVSSDSIEIEENKNDNEEKEKEAEQILIEGLKFDWDLESEIEVEVEDEDGVVVVVDHSDTKMNEKEEEKEEAWFKTEEKEENNEKEEGLGFHIYEDPSDPIENI